MSAYDLDFDEVVITEIKNMKWEEGPGFKKKGNVVLTNKNIIWCRKGFFGGLKEPEKTGLDKVKLYENRVQAKVDKIENSGAFQLKIYYTDHDVTYRTNEKKKAKEFVRELNKLITGEDPTMQDIFASQILPNAEVVAESLKETLNVFVNAFGTQVTGACSSCGASISGVKGQTVSCPYCNGSTKL
ncbi:MAG: hypothetical protein ACI4F4_06990 [Lachnospiraceae bacterium]